MNLLFGKSIQSIFKAHDFDRLIMKFFSSIVSHFDIAVVLWLSCFVAWVRFLTHFETHPWTWTHCKLGEFLFHFGRQYSSKLLVLMSVEKMFRSLFSSEIKNRLYSEDILMGNRHCWRYFGSL